MTQTTELDLEAIEARAEAATPGPWGIGNGDTIGTEMEQISRGACRYMHKIVSFDDEDYDDDWAEPRDVGSIEDDAAFIAHARTDVPALVAEVRRLRQLVQS